MRKNRSMTRSVETEPKAAWAIEIVREGDEVEPSEFYSVVALRVDPDGLQILTPGGTQVSFKTRDVKKVLMMRIKDEEEPAST